MILSLVMIHLFGALFSTMFWGFDGLAMLRAYLEGDAWFDGPAWDDAARERPGVQRRA